MASNWIERLYVEPRFFFKYYGFEWVQSLDEKRNIFSICYNGGECVFCHDGLFVSIFGNDFLFDFYLFGINRCDKLFEPLLLSGFTGIFDDIFACPSRFLHRRIFIFLRLKKISSFLPGTIYIIIFQLTVVYTFAGIAKLQSDWLLRAMPLAIWLPERAGTPVLGYFFEKEWVAYAFCWFGAFYDLTIAWFLMFRKTRIWAYVAVVIFHVFTKLLFNIGLFPIIMIFCTLIFFSADFHQKLLGYIGYRGENPKVGRFQSVRPLNVQGFKLIRPFLIIYIFVQIALPLHHYLYKGRVLWTEEGYRLSWRVMVIEKNGQAIFKIEDSATNRKSEIINSDYLTEFQEKQMSIQPDFIVQYAQFLKKEYEDKHDFKNPIITADVHVALNGRTSKRLIDANVNLAEEQFNLKSRDWILKYD